jgi:hypothetical protein
MSWLPWPVIPFPAPVSSGNNTTPPSVTTEGNGDGIYQGHA